MSKYALSLAKDGRVLSATYERFAPPVAVLVDELPEGNLSDYRWQDGTFVYNPLPEPEPEPETPSQLDRLEADNKLLKEKVAALSDQNDFQEELIVELANIVYA